MRKTLLYRTISKTISIAAACLLLTSQIVLSYPANRYTLRPAAYQASLKQKKGPVLPPVLSLEEGIKRLEEMILKRLKQAEQNRKDNLVVVIDGLSGTGSTYITEMIRKRGIAGFSSVDINIIERDKLGHDDYYYLEDIFSKNKTLPSKLMFVEGLNVADFFQNSTKRNMHNLKMPDIYVKVVADTDTRLLRIDKKRLPKKYKINRFYTRQVPARFDLIIDNSLLGEKKDEEKAAGIRDSYRGAMRKPKRTISGGLRKLWEILQDVIAENVVSIQISTPASRNIPPDAGKNTSAAENPSLARLNTLLNNLMKPKCAGDSEKSSGLSRKTSPTGERNTEAICKPLEAGSLLVRDLEAEVARLEEIICLNREKTESPKIDIIKSTRLAIKKSMLIIEDLRHDVSNFDKVAKYYGKIAKWHEQLCNRKEAASMWFEAGKYWKYLYEHRKHDRSLDKAYLGFEVIAFGNCYRLSKKTNHRLAGQAAAWAAVASKNSGDYAEAGEWDVKAAESNDLKTPESIAQVIRHYKFAKDNFEKAKKKLRIEYCRERIAHFKEMLKKMSPENASLSTVNSSRDISQAIATQA